MHNERCDLNTTRGYVEISLDFQFSALISIEGTDVTRLSLTDLDSGGNSIFNERFFNLPALYVFLLSGINYINIVTRFASGAGLEPLTSSYISFWLLVARILQFQE